MGSDNVSNHAGRLNIGVMAATCHADEEYTGRSAAMCAQFRLGLSALGDHVVDSPRNRVINGEADGGDNFYPKGFCERF